MKFLPLLMLPLLLLVGCDQQEPAHTFVVLNDIHYRGPQDDAFLRSEFDWVRNTFKPELILVAGDLTQDGTSEQFQGLRLLLPSSMVLTPGAYDNKVSHETWGQVLPNDDRNGTINKIGNWYIVGFDSTDGIKTSTPTVSVQQPILDWLTNNMKTIPPDANIAMFTNMPMHDNSSRLKNYQAVMDAIGEHTISRFFCGHIHYYDEMCWNSTYVSTCRTFSNWGKNWDGLERGVMVVDLKGDEIEARLERYPIIPDELKVVK